MWASLLSRLQPEIVERRDTCFTRIAAAVLDGSFDFTNAALRDGALAETRDTLLGNSDLATLLANAPPGSEASEAPSARPAALARFRASQAPRPTPHA